MVEAVYKKQKELTIKLDKIVANKTKKLTQQLIELQNAEVKVNKCYSKCRTLVDDVSVDSMDRKTEILTVSKALLSDNKLVVFDNFKVVESADIVTKIDTKSVINALKKCGDVMADNKALPPIITVKDVKDISVEVNIRTEEKNVIGYRLKYGEYDDDSKVDFDDMKVDCKVIDVNQAKGNVNYKIESLKPLTNYLLY
eukprot:234224_1